MEISYCPFCGSSVKKQSKCESCGSDLMPFLMMPSPEQLREGMERIMEQLGEGSESWDEFAERMKDPGAKGFYISVSTNDKKEPIIKTGDIKDLEGILKDLPIPDFVRENLDIDGVENPELEFSEAKVEKFPLQKGELLKVYMPGVRDIEKVEIVRRGELLEITGRGESRIHFAEVEVGENTMVRESSLEGGVLKVTVEGL